MLTIGSLFSGIGGLELGLEWAGLGPTVWQVENDAFCRRVLARHWPDADRSVVDVRRAGRANLAPVDLVCGGFPCQDVSSAGAGAGLAGSRSGLWFEFERIVRELEPRFVVVENVTSGAKRWVDDVVAGLEISGYCAVPFPLSAQDVGAWHIRRRVFVVAHIASQPLRDARLPRIAGCVGDATDVVRGAVRDEQQRESRRRSSGVRYEGQDESGHDGEERNAADHHRQRRCRWTRQGRQGWRDQPQNGDWWRTEPDVVRVVHGIPNGVDRRKSLGNSVVPQCAEVIGWIVRELMGESA